MPEDISECKQSFNDSESHLRAVLETIIDGIITINSKGIIQTVNPATVRIFGYNARELSGQNVKILMPEPYQNEHDGYLHNYLTTGEKKIIGIGREVTGKRKDGSTFPMELAVSEMEVNGERMFTGIVRDITERKQHVSDIHAREQRIQTLIDTIVDGIIVIDARGLIETFNPAAETLFGYHSDEVKGQNVKVLMPQPYAGEHDGYLHNYLTTGEKKIIGIGREVTGKRKDGSTFPMELAVSEMEINGERMFTGIVRDISERKSVEKTLAEKNLALEATAAYERTQSQAMALFSTRYDSADAFQEVLGLLAEAHDIPVSAVYLFDEWQGVLQCVASYGLPEGEGREITPGHGIIGQTALNGKQILLTAPEAMPFTIDTGMFSINPAAMISSPIIYSGKVLGVIALANIKPFEKSELSFIKHLTDQLAVSLHNLSQYHDLKELSEQMKQRGREISQKNAELEQANRLKTEFLANMSHELRTPLNAIIGFSDVLKDSLLGKLNEEQQDYVGEIYTSANHLLSLINDILDLSKIEAGKMEIYLQPVNMSELLSNALSIVKESAHARNIELNVNISDEIGIMKGDGRKLKQIVFNLLSNAVKFTPDGGKVTLTAQIADNKLSVNISDTGIGIPEDKIGMLFKPFEQLDGSLSRQYEGTGLGLVMVKRLVELHGGQVNVSSKEGQGSSFEFIIPYLKDEGDVTEINPGIPSGSLDEMRLSRADSQQENSATRLTSLSETALIQPEILMVEDDDAAAELMDIQLRNCGYLVYRVRTGNEGLRLMQTRRPDLVILDILLPDIDGWELMRTMKRNSSLQDIQVIVVSIVADTKKGIELGAVNVFEKPVSKKDLLNAVHQALPVATSSESFRILVVDDEEKSVQFMVEQLQSAGFQATGAYGGQEGIDAARSEYPDLIILDLMMPQVTGFDVIAALRRESETHDIPIIVLTAKVLTGDDRQRLNEQVMQIVEKSDFDSGQFLVDVQTALSKSRFVTSIISSPKQADAPRVLVVEDNKNQADLMKFYLEDAGFSVTMAGNGSEALAEMKKSLPDLITLDLLMPDMDGFAFLEAKSGIPEYATIPVMVLSAVADQVEGSPLAADAVLRKPIRRTELLPMIESLLPTRCKHDKARPKLLLVDDDPKAIKIVSSYLPEKHYDIISAFGGADGIELAKAEMPDIVILDVMMPEVNGFDVLASLKQDINTRHIPVIILTAKILSLSERQGIQYQVAAIAEKGKASRELLTGEIERILRRYQRK